jgi:hypothetical protein
MRRSTVVADAEKTYPREEVSQSEWDWALVKRALAHDDNQEEVIRRIADYRADEKHPNYAPESERISTSQDFPPSVSAVEVIDSSAFGQAAQHCRA